MTEKILAAAVVNALSDGQGQFPWGDDIESWLEVRDAAEIAADIRAYASAEADRAAAEERERCAKVCQEAAARYLRGNFGEAAGACTHLASRISGER